MPVNRVQFQKGLPMREFLKRYGTDELCEAALVRQRWPMGFVCPRCSAGSARTTFVRETRRYWQCASCQYQCSVLSGTMFESSKLALTTWFLAMQLLTQSKNNVSALELKRHLGVSYRTAWLVKHKILEGMRLAEEDRQLTGRVEIDDAYLGGERSGGKAGRGSENKVPFFAAVQTTDDGWPRFACLSQRPFTNEAMQEFLDTHTALPLTLVSDGLSWRIGISKAPARVRWAPRWWGMRGQLAKTSTNGRRAPPLSKRSLPSNGRSTFCVAAHGVQPPPTNISTIRKVACLSEIRDSRYRVAGRIPYARHSPLASASSSEIPSDVDHCRLFTCPPGSGHSLSAPPDEAISAGAAAWRSIAGAVIGWSPKLHTTSVAPGPRPRSIAKSDGLGCDSATICCDCSAGLAFLSRMSDCQCLRRLLGLASWVSTL